MEESSTTRQRPTPTSVWRERRRERFEGVADLERLREAIEEGEVEHSDATFALELVRRSELAGEKQRALFVAALGVSAARARGNVRLDLTGGGVEGLARRLRHLLPTLLESVEDVEEVATQLQTFADGEVSSELLGYGEGYRPLVIEDGHLYTHADRLEEKRLAGGLADRLEPGWRGDEWPESAEYTEEELEEAMSRVVGDYQPAPTTEQQYAIATAATSPLSVITGGPGTGKTSLIVSLLRLLGSLEVDPEQVALAAPTGKAADRLGAAIDEQLVDGDDLDARVAEQLEEPATIHRLLGYSQRRREFYHDAFRPLPHRYVVVDEASMIDLELMDRLVAAVDDEAKLVLVGDADQLPAVGSGAAFRDLVPGTIQTETPRRRVLTGDDLEVERSEEPVAAQSMRLTRNFRMRPDDPEGSNVLAVAQAVRDGGDRLEFSRASRPVHDGGREDGGQEDGDRQDGGSGETGALDHDEPAITKRSSFDELTFRGAELLTRAPGSWIEEWYDQLIADEVLGDVQWREALEFEAGRPSETAVARLDDLFEAFQQYQLLGVARHRRRGVARLDVHLHRRHVARQRLPKADEFAVGEPVMMTRNDYERDLFNGDRGIILPVRDRDTGNEQKRAIFPRRSGYAAFALGPLRADLDHAWSITVHKSQGSEYDAVGLVLPDEHIALSTRELIYTGITRARHAVTFFGDPTRIRDAARETDERNTGLLERLGS